MAKNTSLVKIKGSIDGMTFYRNRYGDIVQKKSSLNGDKIRNSPQFKRTRENMEEFGMSATSGKNFRHALATLTRRAYDPSLVQRMVSVCNILKKLDTINSRGERTTAEGYNTIEGKSIMTGLELNSRANLSQILHREISLDISTGTLSISQFFPRNHLIYPEGATHVNFTSAYLGVYWDTGDYEIFYSNEVSIALNNSATDIELIPSDLPTLADAPLFYVLLIEFAQEVNGELYTFSNGQYNVLQVVWAG